MANTSAFETSDHVALKGQVSGVTRISKKVKVLFFFGGLALLIFLIFTIFTIDGANETTSANTDVEGQEQPKGNGGHEPAKGDVVTKGIGNGNAALVTSSPTIDLKDGVALPAGATGPSIVLPSGSGGSASKSAAGGASSGQPSVIVPSPTAGADGAPTVAPAPTPAEVAAKRLADLREQQREQAMKASIEVGSGGWDGGGIRAAGAQASSTPIFAGIPGASSAPGAAGFVAPPRGQDQDDQNKQMRKESFLREAESKGSQQYYLKETRQSPISKYELKMGWKIPAFLIDGINSDLPGQVCAQVRENVYDSATGMHLLIPQGAKVCGTYDSQIAVGQKRILMAWNRIMFDDGSTLALAGMPGADQAGYAGFDAEVDNHYFKVFTSALMMSVISAGIQLSQPQQSSQGGQPTASQTAAAAVGQQVGQVASGLIQRDLKIQPTLTQEPGYRFNIQVTRDIAFSKPYKRS